MTSVATSKSRELNAPVSLYPSLLKYRSPNYKSLYIGTPFWGDIWAACTRQGSCFGQPARARAQPFTIGVVWGSLRARARAQAA